MPLDCQHDDSGSSVLGNHYRPGASQVAQPCPAAFRRSPAPSLPVPLRSREDSYGEIVPHRNRPPPLTESPSVVSSSPHRPETNSKVNPRGARNRGRFTALSARLDESQSGQQAIRARGRARMHARSCPLRQLDRSSPALGILRKARSSYTASERGSSLMAGALTFWYDPLKKVAVE